MWDWGKIKEKVTDWGKKLVPPIPLPPPPEPQVVADLSNNPRMTSYLDYRLNDAIISYIEADNTRLYYEAFNPEQTVQTLQDQYLKITGKELVLQNEEVKISPTMPLMEILYSSQNRQVFQEILEKLDKKQSVKIEGLSEEKRENLVKIIKKCNEFSNYECEIYMHHGLRKPLRCKRPITGDTNFKSIIGDLTKHPLINGDDIEFFSKAGKNYDPACYQQSFGNLGIQEPVLVGRYSYRKSLIRGDTRIAVKGKEILIREAAELPKGVEVLSYNSKELRMQRNKDTSLREDLVGKFYRLTLSMKLKKGKEEKGEGVKEEKPEEKEEKEIEEKPIILEATGSVRVFILTQNFDQLWFPISKLTKQHQIGGLHPRDYSFCLYQIQSIEEVVLEQPEPFFSLEVLPAHQFIANRIILHNCNSFTIRAKFLGENPREEEVKFDRNHTIHQHFQDKVCQVGGFTLNNRMTFGDYQLDQFQIIYVFEGEEGEEALNAREHTISQWQKVSIDRDNAEPAHLEQFNQKLKDEYFGIYKKRIISSTEIDNLYAENKQGVINVLVALRMHFERINYHINKEPSFRGKDKELFQQKLQKFKEKPTYKAALKVGKGMGLSDIQVMGIYLYTTNDNFGPINYYLRAEYINNIPEKQHLNLPTVSWMARSVRKAQAYRGTAYRGITGIDLKNALNLKHYGPEGEEGMQYRQKFIIFYGFTSTSKVDSGARQFIKEAGTASNCLFTIKVNRGHQIETFSQFPDEKEVLILPFTYFLINDYNLEGPIQTAQLQEIPMPETDKEKLIFWVDDEPEGNYHIVDNFQKEGIEVVQVTSTRIMKVILGNFFWIFKMMGRKVVIISDMVRKQGEKFNYTAGVDLFQHIYNDYGLSNKAIIFTKDVPRAEQNLKERGVVTGNWVVLKQAKDLIQTVLDEFKNME